MISFRTTYVHIGGEVVSDSKRIRNNYIKGWFALDLISSVPLEMIDMIIEQIDTNEKAVGLQHRQQSHLNMNAIKCVLDFYATATDKTGSTVAVGAGH